MVNYHNVALEEERATDRKAAFSKSVSVLSLVERVMSNLTGACRGETKGSRCTQDAYPRVQPAGRDSGNSKRCRESIIPATVDETWTATSVIRSNHADRRKILTRASCEGCNVARRNRKRQGPSEAQKNEMTEEKSIRKSA